MMACLFPFLFFSALHVCVCVLLPLKWNMLQNVVPAMLVKGHQRHWNNKPLSDARKMPVCVFVFVFAVVMRALKVVAMLRWDITPNTSRKKTTNIKYRQNEDKYECVPIFGFEKKKNNNNNRKQQTIACVLCCRQNALLSTASSISSLVERHHRFEDYTSLKFSLSLSILMLRTRENWLTNDWRKNRSKKKLTKSTKSEQQQPKRERKNTLWRG